MGHKIAVIDDEVSVCRLLEKLLVKEGYEVKTESDPVKGIEMVEQFKPECILMDIKMPTIDGIEVLTRVKESDSSIAVIMVTGYGNLETAMESMKLGAFDYITKPFDLDFIKTLVERALKERK